MRGPEICSHPNPQPRPSPSTLGGCSPGCDRSEFGFVGSGAGGVSSAGSANVGAKARKVAATAARTMRMFLSPSGKPMHTNRPIPSARQFTVGEISLLLVSRTRLPPRLSLDPRRGSTGASSKYRSNSASGAAGPGFAFQAARPQSPRTAARRRDRRRCRRSDHDGRA